MKRGDKVFNMLVEIPSKVTARVLGAYTGKLQRDAPLIFSILSFFFSFFPSFRFHFVTINLCASHPPQQCSNTSPQSSPRDSLHDKEAPEIFSFFPFFFFLNEHVLELIICWGSSCSQQNCSYKTQKVLWVFFTSYCSQASWVYICLKSLAGKVCLSLQGCSPTGLFYLFEANWNIWYSLHLCFSPKFTWISNFFFPCFVSTYVF